MTSEHTSHIVVRGWGCHSELAFLWNGRTVPVGHGTEAALAQDVRGGGVACVSVRGGREGVG